jgi:hypothetical protein
MVESQRRRDEVTKHIHDWENRLWFSVLTDYRLALPRLADKAYLLRKSSEFDLNSHFWIKNDCLWNDSENKSAFFLFFVAFRR